MLKLLSRSKHEESSQTQHCRSKIRRKEKQNVNKMEHCRSAFATATVHPACTVPTAPVLLHFTHLLFLLQFFVFLFSTLVIITYVWIVWYFTCFVRLYKPFVYTVERDDFCCE